MYLDKRWKLISYSCLLFSLLMALVVASSTVYGFPGNENITASTVNDTRIGQGDAITWTMPILNNATNWLNITVIYNSTSYGPYNVTITPAGNAVINHVAPATYGNYTVYFTTVGATQNATYTGLLVDHYLIDLTALYSEVEAGLYTRISAVGESVLDGHQVTFGDTVNVLNVGVMLWEDMSSTFYGTSLSATPVTRVFNTLTSFNEATYGITSAEINTTATVTWTTGIMDIWQNELVNGNWVGGLFDIMFVEITQIGGWSLLMAIFSIGVYNYSGPYAMFGIWILGWGGFSTQVHGVALIFGRIMLVLGLGIALAKLYLDRRTT